MHGDLRQDFEYKLLVALESWSNRIPQESLSLIFINNHDVKVKKEDMEVTMSDDFPKPYFPKVSFPDATIPNNKFPE